MHNVHSDWPSVAVMLPAAQAKQEVDPVFDCHIPAEQSPHVLMVVAPNAVDEVPTAQARHVV